MTFSANQNSNQHVEIEPNEVVDKRQKVLIIGGGLVLSFGSLLTLFPFFIIRENDVGAGVVFVFALAVLGKVIFFADKIQKQQEGRRSRLLAETCKSLGLNRSDRLKVLLVNTFSQYVHFRCHAISQKNISNIYFGKVNDVDSILFEHKYTSGSSDHPQVIRQTFIGFFNPEQDGKFLHFSPYEPWDRYVFCGPESPFPSHPDFARAYRFKAENPSEVAAYIKPEVLNKIAEDKSWYIEVTGNWTLISQPYESWDPASGADENALERFIKDANWIASQLFESFSNVAEVSHV